MAHTLTEVPGYDPVTVPDPADTRNAASVQAGMQNLANRDGFIKGKAYGMAPATDQQLPLIVQAYGTQYWVTNAAAGCPIQSDIGGARSIALELDLPVGAVVTSVKVWVTNFGSHGTLVGLTMPTATVQSMQPSSGLTVALLGPISDPSANAAAYDVAHNIPLTGSFTVAVNKRYFVTFSGETGAPAVSLSLTITGVSATWTIP